MLADYLKTIQHVTLLTPDEERRLWDLYRREDDVDSRLRLIEAYQPLVFKLVMQVRPPDPVLLDMIQEGTVGLIEAVERFDHLRGVRFSTFATYRIRGRVLNSLRRDHPVEYSLDQDVQGEATLDGRLADPAADAALASIEDAALVRAVRDIIDGFPERERVILQATYVDSRTPHRVAAELRISLSHFYRLHKQAIERLRRLILDDAHLPEGARGY